MSTRVTSSDPRQPRREEKKKNIGGPYPGNAKYPLLRTVTPAPNGVRAAEARAASRS
ncbi:hypothetical protein GCM10023088_30260 [Actinomadura verrucosospora]